jgi:Ni/Co efflux regulator RcnB
MSAHVFDSRDSSSPVRPSIWAFVVAIVVTGVACWIVVDLAPPSFRVAAAWFVGSFALLLSVATAFAVFGLLEGRALRLGVETAQDDADAEVHAAHEQVQAATGNLARQLDEVRAAAVADVYAARRENDAEAAAIAEHVVPDLVRRLEAGASTETALAEIEQPRSDWGRSVVRALALQMGRVERTKAAALAACASAASRMQAQTTSMAAELRDMEDSADSGTLARLLEVDHHNAQVGRLADSIAVLTGARSGRRWARPIAMESILRGAMSRINDYRRVQLHAPVEVAVVGYAAEGVIHLLAELVDNAAQFSPPSEQVHIYVEEAHAGVVVAI